MGANPAVSFRFAPVQPMLAAAAVLTALRFAAGAFLPLSADEAYYWLWSKHLAAGYLDHPPAIAWLIRAGTALLGNTPFGVRFFAMAGSALASALVWRSGAELFDDERAGALVVLFFNLTLMVTVEGLAATPDAPALLGAAGVLYALVRLETDNRGRWWLAAGLAGGFMLLSKFTAFFLGAGVLTWMVFTPDARRWLASPWSYAGLLVALLVYLPNAIWNAHHHWATYTFQFARIGGGDWTLRFLGEFLIVLLVLISPFIFILGAKGMSRAAHDDRMRLPAALMVPALLFFFVDALHARVQANWPSFLLPAFALLAAASAVERRSRASRLSARAAIPVAALMLGAAYLQALFGVAPIGRADPLSRLLGFGMPQVAQDLAHFRSRAHVAAIVVSDYELGAWLAFYLPRATPLFAIGEPARWGFVPQAAHLSPAATVLYAVEDKRDRRAPIARNFGLAATAGTVPRKRGAVIVGRYNLYEASGFGNAAVLTPLP